MSDRHAMTPLLDAVELAERLGVKPGWVYAQARANRIPHIRLGRYRRFHPDSIAAWIEEREQGPVPPREMTRWEAPRRSRA